METDIMDDYVYIWIQYQNIVSMEVQDGFGRENCGMNLTPVDLGTQ